MCTAMDRLQCLAKHNCSGKFVRANQGHDAWFHCFAQPVQWLETGGCDFEVKWFYLLDTQVINFSKLTQVINFSKGYPVRALCSSACSAGDQIWSAVIRRDLSANASRAVALERQTSVDRTIDEAWLTCASGQDRRTYTCKVTHALTCAAVRHYRFPCQYKNWITMSFCSCALISQNTSWTKLNSLVVNTKVVSRTIWLQRRRFELVRLT